MKYLTIIILTLSTYCNITDLIKKLESDYCTVEKKNITIEKFKKKYTKDEHEIISNYTIDKPYIDKEMEYDMLVFNLDITDKEKNEEDIKEMLKRLDYLKDLKKSSKDFNSMGIQNYVNCYVKIKNKNSIFSTTYLSRLFIKVEKMEKYYDFLYDFEIKRDFYLNFLKSYLKLKKLNYFLYKIPENLFLNSSKNMIILPLFYYYNLNQEGLGFYNKELSLNLTTKITKEITSLQRKNYYYYYPKLIELCNYSTNEVDCKFEDFKENQEKWVLGLLYFNLFNINIDYEINNTLKCPHDYIDGFCFSNIKYHLSQLNTKHERLFNYFDIFFGILESDFNTIQQELNNLIII